MIFTETKLKGAFVIDIEPLEDERGFFARAWSKEEFEQHGLNPLIVHCNISLNKKRGTLRGMHYQAPPFEEAKLVRCTRGAIYDVIIDLRNKSPTFHEWFSVELTADNHRALYVPKGFAHGFQTLIDHSEVFYQMSDIFHPEYARSLRWDDLAFRIVWPISDPILSEKDSNSSPWSMNPYE